MKLLIVEDDKQLSESIVKYLRQNNFLCDVAQDYQQAEDKLLDSDYDCVVLDITLPGGNGLQLLARLKSLNKSDGVIIISAKHALADRINGLGSGADDYLTKPFHLAELSARIDAIIRRRFFNGKHVITIKHLSVNITDKNVKIGEDYIELTRKEYELLLYFISNQNKVITKEAIIEHLWGYDVGLSNNYDFLYAHIKNLRKKMFFEGSTDFIQVIYGLGYKFTTS